MTAPLLLAAVLAGLALQGPGNGASCAAGPLPVPVCTPGSTDPRVTQANIHQTICLPGYSATVRPPLAVTGAWKRQLLREAGLPRSAGPLVEGDHLVPIEGGGNPGAVLRGGQWQPTGWHTNFWLERWTRPDGLGAHRKDVVEGAMHQAICAGTLTLDAAQRAIATDWVALGCQLSVLPCPAAREEGA